jgi:hypothetical protein
MKKRKSLTREIAVAQARHTRKYKRDMFEAACEKGKVETYRDVFGVFFGLSRKAIEVAALSEIIRLAHFGFSPDKIVKCMEGGDKKQL